MQLSYAVSKGTKAVIHTPGGNFQMVEKRHLTIIILTLKHIVNPSHIRYTLGTYSVSGIKNLISHFNSS